MNFSRKSFWFLRRKIIELSAPKTAPYAARTSRRELPARPKVSIIIPTYNRAADVLTAVRSVLQQTYQDIEIIVVDDGSEDDTVRALEELATGRVRIIRNSHGGVSAARNAGIRSARGELLAFLDDDDYFKPRKVEQFVRFYLEHPDCSFVHGYWFEEHERSGLMTLIQPYVEGDARHHLLMFAPLSITTAMFRKDLVSEDVGLFREEMGLAEDLDFMIRASAFGPIGLIREPLTVVKIHARNTPRLPDVVHQNQKSIIQRAVSHYPDGRASAVVYYANAALYAALRRTQGRVVKVIRLLARRLSGRR